MVVGIKRKPQRTPEKVDALDGLVIVAEPVEIGGHGPCEEVVGGHEAAVIILVVPGNVNDVPGLSRQKAQNLLDGIPVLAAREDDISGQEEEVQVRLEGKLTEKFYGKCMKLGVQVRH
jgi:hypothetical protein